MRRLALPLALMLGLLMSGSVSAAGRTAFTGEWIGMDPAPPAGDGSVLHLYVSGGTHAKITLTDEYGTVCVNNGSPVLFFTSTLTGVVVGDELFATFRSARCGRVPLRFLTGESTSFVLDEHDPADPADDTLSDGYASWQRVS